MDSELERKIQALLDDEGGSFRALVEALQGASAVDLAETAAHEAGWVRAAAAQAAGGRTEPEALEAAEKLACDSFEEVRKALANALAAAPDWPVPDLVWERLFDDRDEEVSRRMAARAAAGKARFRDTLLQLLAEDEDWEVREEAARSLATVEGDAVLPALVSALASDELQDVSRTCAQSAETQLERLDGWPADTAKPRPALVREGWERLRAIGTNRYPRLARWLEERATHDVDPELLDELGTDLTSEAEAGRLPHAYGLDHAVDPILRVLKEGATRSAVLLGDSGTGKTAVVNELVHRLREDPDGPWRVLRITPTEFLAGTLYLGEWETKVRNLVRATEAPKRVLVYIPNIHELSQAGRSSKTDMNIASMLAPHIESGAVAILGETTADAFRQGLGRIGSLRRLFATIELDPATREDTRLLLDAVCAEMEAEPAPEVLDRLMDLADFYLQGIAQPGRALGLFRRVAESRGLEGLRARDILLTLCESTGIPVDFLDDDVPLDLEKVRDFFESRVMGQTEAIDAVLDLVTLIKAGLTDPNKPYGVLLFIGPTGVGKTELARTLAELIFGDPASLTRFDMSEYATYSAYERLNGTHDKPGLLTEAVRDRPFRVVLLDEIEKAHANVFDLCLQIFDAGRLTDGSGRTADFRRTILVLTSNLGAAARLEPQVGFAGTQPPPPDRDTTFRELTRFFRPEFLNRIDRILYFRPLTEGTAERIARREVARVIERSGISRRKLAVDVAPEVLSLLLREGYSPAFGARPLKRTVERRVLLPVARRIATGPVAEGSVLHLGARGSEVTVEIVAPDGREDEEDVAPAAPGIESLLEEVAALRECAERFEVRKSQLLEQTGAPGFWNDHAGALRTMDEIHRFDTVLKSLDHLREQVQITARNPDPKRASEFVAAQSREALRLRHLFDCDDLRDAIVVISRVKRQGTPLHAVERLARMYRGVAARRRMECEVIDDRMGGEPPEDTIALALNGAGAHALLSSETGLHQFTRNAVNERGAPREDRELVRVEVLAGGGEECELGGTEFKVDGRVLRDVKGRLMKEPRFEVTLLHRPTMTSVKAWSDRENPQAAAQAVEPLLRARLQQPPVREEATAIRRYCLGPQPVVRDRRLHLSTGRVDKVLAGDLDLFLGPARS